MVFLPSVGDIKQLYRRLTEEYVLFSDDIDVCPLYGQLDSQAQQMAITPSTLGRRKIVLATNIAETSLTIEGIRLVVDSGLERVARFDPETGITRLEENIIAQSSAQQRAGRAGRLEPGICFRMYSEESLKRQPIVPQAEILRSDLTSLQMELLQWGTSQVDELSWLDLPPAPHLQQAKQLLIQLGLLNPQGQLTKLATQSQTLGIEPRYAAMLSHANVRGEAYLQAALASVALLEEPERNSLDISHDWHRWQQNQHSKTAMLTRRSQQLARRCSISFGLNLAFELKKVDADLLAVCIAMAFPDRVAMRRRHSSGQYLLANGHGAYIDESSSLSNQEGLIAVDLMRNAQSMTSQIFRAIHIDWSALIDALPDRIVERDVVQWDDAKGKMIAEQQQCFGQLVLSRRHVTHIDPTLIQAAILDFIRRKGLSSLSWSDKSANLLQRIRNATEWLPDKGWPGVSDDILLAKLEHWLEPYMVGIDTISKIKQIDVHQALSAYLGWPLNKEIDTWLPTHYQLPTGTRKAIRYQEKCDPILSVRMQEMFGESDSPLIAQGRKKLVLELLSPAQRPLQVTQDLAGFWQGSYKEVQKEMKGRYPKHIWPDDPANHVATTKMKRHFQP